MQKNWFAVFSVKVTARAYIIKILLFLLYLLNCWSVCNQTWFDSITSEAGESCGKIGLLCSRSRTQQNILLLYLVWWCSIMSQSVMQKTNCLQFSRSRSQQGMMWSENDSFYYIFWTLGALATKLGLMIHHHKPVSCEKNWITAFKVQVTMKGQNVSVCPDDIF